MVKKTGNSRNRQNAFTFSLDDTCESIHQAIVHSDELFEALEPLEKSFYRMWLQEHHPTFNPVECNSGITREIICAVELMQHEIKPHVTVGSFFEAVSTRDLHLFLKCNDCSDLFIKLAIMKSKKIDTPLYLPTIVEEDYVAADKLSCHCFQSCSTLERMENFKIKCLNTVCLLRALADETARQHYYNSYLLKCRFLESEYLVRQFGCCDELLPDEYEKKLPPWAYLDDPTVKDPCAHLRYQTKDKEWYIIAGGDRKNIGYLLYAVVTWRGTGTVFDWGSLTLDQLKAFGPTLDREFTPMAVSEIRNQKENTL